MDYCPHCTNHLEKSTYICPNCGCLIDEKYYIKKNYKPISIAVILSLFFSLVSKIFLLLMALFLYKAGLVTANSKYYIVVLLLFFPIFMFCFLYGISAIFDIISLIIIPINMFKKKKLHAFCLVILGLANIFSLFLVLIRDNRK